MDNYFESPEKAVDLITLMLQNESWETLTSYYDLTNSFVPVSEFLSGNFFVPTEEPEVRHPGGFWKYKHPFSPGFSFNYASTHENVVTVYLSIEIDEGGGKVQRGIDSFKLVFYPGKGYKIMPPT